MACVLHFWAQLNMSTRIAQIYIIQILKWEFITHWLKLTWSNKTPFNLGLLNYIHTWIQSVKLQNHSQSLNQVLLHNSDPCSTLPFPLVCDLALVCTVLPDSVHSKLFLWFSSCQVYFHTQAPATKVLSRCRLIIKLLRGHSLVQKERLSPQGTSQVAPSVWLMLTILPLGRPITQASFAKMLAPPLCGTWHCTYHVWSSELAWAKFTASSEDTKNRSHRNTEISWVTQRNLQAWYPEVTASSNWQLHVEVLIGYWILSDMSNTLRVRVCWRDTI